MNILFAIFEIIRTALIWAMGLILDREPQAGEAYRLLFLILFTGAATWLTFYWRDVALRWRAIRKRLLPEERYAGRYLQAVRRADGIRYSIVHILYNPRKRRFEALGRNYNPSGEETSSFRSHNIVFPAEQDDTIEFIWQGRRAAAGYTCMKIDSRQSDYVEGGGYIITFGQKPKSFPLMFKRMHSGHVREALGIGLPAHPKEESSFIRKFHADLGEAVRHGFESEAEEVA